LKIWIKLTWEYKISYLPLRFKTLHIKITSEKMAEVHESFRF